MQFFRSLIIALCVSIPLQAALEWHTDYAEVKNLSKQENKPALLFFNGSDWAGSAMKMKHEILTSPSFQKEIGGRFICMEIDFPKHTTLSAALALQNSELKTRFQVEDLPSLLLLDNQERIIAQVGYLPETGEQLAADLIKLLEQDEELICGLRHLDTAAVTSPQLKKLYQLAQELGQQSAIEHILNTGVKNEDPFCCLEKYRLLVERGEMKSEEALVLRQKLLSFNPESELMNGQRIPFTLALIDFQELSRNNCDLEIIAQPLVEYLARFENIDQKNIWRIEMMLAEIYVEGDKWEEALKHAERAYLTAPETMRAQIAHSLDYIRSAPTTTR